MEIAVSCRLSAVSRSFQFQSSVFSSELSVTFDFSAENLDREFPVRRNLVYFNHAAVAPLPRRVAEAMIGHVENARDRGAADWKRWFAAIEKTRETAARLLSAHRSEMAFLPSTSWALNLVARSFPLERGDNVVGDDMEFPSNSLPWRLLERRGIEYRTAKSRGGRVEVEDLEREIDDRDPDRRRIVGRFPQRIRLSAPRDRRDLPREADPLRRGRDPGAGSAADST